MALLLIVIMIDPSLTTGGGKCHEEHLPPAVLRLHLLPPAHRDRIFPQRGRKDLLRQRFN